MKATHPKASFILGGDRNSIPLDVFSHLYPGIHQINFKPTRKGKILDFISTDLYKFYQTPEILNPHEPDDPSKAKKSDHMIPIARPKSVENISSQNNKKVIVKRPMPQSAIDSFGRWVGLQSWVELSNETTADKITDKFINIVQSKIDEMFPLKTCKVPKNNKPWFTHKLRTLSKKKKLIFKKGGRSDNYKATCKEFINARKIAINEYLDKTIDTVSRKNAPGLHRALKKLGAASGDTDKKNFKLNEHEGLTEQEIADDLGNFFSSISK